MGCSPCFWTSGTAFQRIYRKRPGSCLTTCLTTTRLAISVGWKGCIHGSDMHKRARIAGLVIMRSTLIELYLPRPAHRCTSSGRRALQCRISRAGALAALSGCTESVDLQLLHFKHRADFCYSSLIPYFSVLTTLGSALKTVHRNCDLHALQPPLVSTYSCICLPRSPA